MTQPKPSETIVMCIKSGDGCCCIFDDCTLFKQCFPEDYRNSNKNKKRKSKAKIRS